jgi:hypothetical protein
MVLTNKSMEVDFRASIEEKYHGVLRVENLHAKRVNDQTEIETIGATLVFNYSDAAALFEEETLMCTKAFCMEFRMHRIVCPHMHDAGQDACDFSVDASAFLDTPAGMSSILGAFIILVVFAFLAYKQATRDPGIGKKTISFGGTAFNNPIYSLNGGVADTSNPLYDEIGNSSALYDTPQFAGMSDFQSDYLDLPPAADAFDDDGAYFDIEPDDGMGAQYQDSGEGYLEMDASMYDELGELDGEDGYLQMNPKEEKKAAKAAKKAKAKGARLAAKAAKLGQDTFDGEYLEMGGASPDGNDYGDGNGSGYLDMQGVSPSETEYLETTAAPPTFIYQANKKARKEKTKKKKKQQQSWDDMSGGIYGDDDGGTYMDVGAGDGFGF